MNYEIISIGDARFLADVINAVAMIFNTSSMGAMMRMALGIGVIVVLFQGIMKGAKNIEVQHLFISAIVINGFLLPKVDDVKVVDSYSGNVVVIDNVPLGVAFTGTLISTVGYKITKLFELAYQPVNATTAPKLTESPYVDSLKALTALRKAATSEGLWGSANTASADIALQESWQQYISDCILQKVYVNTATMNDLFTQKIFGDASTPGALKPNASTTNQNTRINKAGALISLTCGDAYTQLTAAMDLVVADSNFLSTLNSSLGVRNYGNNATTAMASLANTSSFMLDATATAQTMTKIALLEPILHKAASGQLSKVDIPAAIMVNEAKQKRNASWTADQSLFNSIVRPSMAFFEAFSYAVTPIMAFVLCLGPSGLGIALKYFMLNLWIQLWLPMMSITNYFLVTVASRNIKEYSTSTAFNYDSFYALNTATDIAQNWIGVAGMLGAAVPVLSMMLLYGSSTVATSIANRLKADSDVNTNYTNPQASNAPALSQISTQDVGTSGMGSSSAALMKTDFSLGSSVIASTGNSAISSMSSSSSSSLLTSFQASSGSSNGTSINSQTMKTIGKQILAKKDEMSSEDQKSLDDYVAKHSQSIGSKEEAASQWAVQGGISPFSFKKGQQTKSPDKKKANTNNNSDTSSGIDTGGAISSKGTSTASMESGDANSSSAGSSVGFSEQTAAALTKAINNGLNTSLSTGAISSDTAADLLSKNDSFNKTSQKIAQIQNSAAESKAFNMEGNIKGVDMVQLAQSKNVDGALNKEYDHLARALKGTPEGMKLEHDQKSFLGYMNANNFKVTGTKGDGSELYSKIHALNNLVNSNSASPETRALASEALGDMLGKTLHNTTENDRSIPRAVADQKHPIQTQTGSSENQLDRAELNATVRQSDISNNSNKIKTEAGSTIRSATAETNTPAFADLQNQTNNPNQAHASNVGNVKSAAINNEFTHQQSTAKDQRQIALSNAPVNAATTPAALISAATGGTIENAGSWIKDTINSFRTPAQVDQLMAAKSPAHRISNGNAQPGDSKTVVDNVAAATGNSNITSEYRRNPQGYDQALKNSLSGEGHKNKDIPDINQSVAAQLATGATLAMTGTKSQIKEAAGQTVSESDYKKDYEEAKREAFAAGYKSPENQALYASAKTQGFTKEGIHAAGSARLGPYGMAAAGTSFAAKAITGHFEKPFHEQNKAVVKMNQLRDQVHNPTDLNSYDVKQDSSRERGFIAFNKQNGEEMFKFTKDEMQMPVNVVLADKNKNDFVDSHISQVESRAQAGNASALSSASLAAPEQALPSVQERDAALRKAKQ